MRSTKVMMAYGLMALVVSLAPQKTMSNTFSEQLPHVLAARTFVATNQQQLVTQLRETIALAYGHTPHASSIEFLGGQNLHLLVEQRPLRSKVLRTTQAGDASFVTLSVESTSQTVNQKEPGPAAWARFSVRTPAMVWALKQPLAKLAHVQCEHLAQQDIGTKPTDAGVLRMTTCQDALLGKLRWPMRAGAILRQADLLPLNVTPRNEIVRLQVAAGGIALETKAIALHDTAMGQLARFKIDHSNAVVQAVMQAPGIATLVEETP